MPGAITITAPNRKGACDDAANVLARLVHRLLPLANAVDLGEINARALPKRYPDQDYRERDPDKDLGTDLMGAVY